MSDKKTPSVESSMSTSIAEGLTDHQSKQKAVLEKDKVTNYM